MQNIEKLDKIEKNLKSLIVRKQEKSNKLEQIVNFFKTNKPPIPDSKYHKFAESIGLEPDKAESMAYNILSGFLSGGKSEGKEFDYDKNEMAMGMKVELEHSKEPLLAHKIALDHLKEDPKYYSKLAKIGL